MINLKNNILKVKFYNHDINEVDHKQIGIEMPRICAHCKNTGTQVLLEGIQLADSNTLLVTACQYCGEVTLHNFQFIIEKGLVHTTIPPLDKEILLKFADISSEIQEKFPEFVKIMKQSQEAEDANLDQLAGMGYRKALEFLVTDFLLEYPQEGASEDWLKNPKTSLSSKIAKLPKERTKNLSKAISFIGNDETHYSKRHPEQDVKSIKMFLKALISDIENEIAYQEAEKFLQKPN
ncbi:DUF4145 domain-containing protein [Enterococcus faecalis]|uniref:DUF4145 domain-containing protein n=1 Tax=Enterococcus faecalis TaxID=1351 RepID=UPI00032DE83C|nr:DUF4145 domain-containing protein [Enterococcus faecalis]EOJ20315.1 hypothetical protein UMS_00456 [Enterococcus faecalis EnGen0287]